MMTEWHILGCVFAISVSVEDNVVTASITDLDGGVRDGSVGAPLDAVTAGLGDGEGLAASLVAVGIKALLDSIIEDRARGDLACWMVVSHGISIED